MRTLFSRASHVAATAGAAALILATIAMAGCARMGQIDAATPDRGTLSPRLQPFVYYEDGVPLFLAADVRAARYVKEGGIFPLGIGMANNGKAALSFGPERFELEDADGTRYPVVGYEEFRRDYRRSKTDVRLAETFDGVMRGKFNNFTESIWNPFPASGEGASATGLELGRNHWAMAYLYFPVPEEGIRGQELTLVVDPGGSAEDERRYRLRFEVQ